MRLDSNELRGQEEDETVRRGNREETGERSSSPSSVGEQGATVETMDQDQE